MTSPHHIIICQWVFSIYHADWKGRETYLRDHIHLSFYNSRPRDQRPTKPVNRPWQHADRCKAHQVSLWRHADQNEVVTDPNLLALGPLLGGRVDRPPTRLTWQEGRKDMFYLTTHSTHFIYGYMASDIWLREREMFYLMTHSTHFIYGYMASDIWLRTILIVREETRCCHIGYSNWLTARVLLYAPSHRQDSTYHGLCYTSRGALAGMRNSSMGPPHKGSIRRPIAPWANALPLSYVPLRSTEQLCEYYKYYLTDKLKQVLIYQ